MYYRRYLTPNGGVSSTQEVMLPKATKSNLDKASRQILRRRIAELTGCKKPEVVREAIMLLRPSVQAAYDARPTLSLERLISEMPIALFSNAVAVAGKRVARQKVRRSRNRRDRRKVHQQNAVYRGPATGAA